MFTQDQIDTLESLASEGISLNSCGTVFNMTMKNFLKYYSESEDAQLSYEKGLARLEIETKAFIKSKMKDDFRYSQYWADNVVGMKKDTKAKAPVEEKQQFNVETDKMSNPHLWLED